MKKEIKWFKEFLFRCRFHFLSFLGSMFISLRYKNVYFFDTNFIVSYKVKLDKRYKKLYTFGKNFYITEPIQREIGQLLQKPNFRKVFKGNLQTISFDDLYLSGQGICPVYYNFIGSMHNPANLGYIDFPLQLIFSKIIKKKEFSDEENKLYSRLMDKLIKTYNYHSNELGMEHARVVGEACIKSIKKRKKGLKGKSKNYPNDLRNLATIFLYALLHRENVTFVTTDSDAVAYFFDWTSTLAQQITFQVKCLSELSKNDKEGMRMMVAGKKKALFFARNELIKDIRSILRNIYSKNGKYFSPRISIKYWDQTREKFYEVDINVDEYTRNCFKNLHGPLNCSTARNNDLGNFIKYIYWSPSSIYDNTIKILPICKSIHRISQQFPSEVHDKICRYRVKDLSNDFDSFRTFI